MPRDASGNYTLPAGNPVIAGTVITSSWANPTMSDIAAELTNSLSRNGQGGMLAPLLFFDGTKNDPSITFTNEPTLGFFRPAQGILGVTGQGNLLVTFDASSGNMTNLEGQSIVNAPLPIDDDHLTRKDYVDNAFKGAFPVGALVFGWNPNGVLDGSWDQWPEGTFLMNTIGGADVAGGDNDAVVVQHNHTADSNGAHTHGAAGNHSHPFSAAQWIGGYTDDGGSPDQRVVVSSSNTSNAGNHSHPSAGLHSHTINNSGVSGANKNKPLYKGVEVWERTA